MTTQTRTLEERVESYLTINRMSAGTTAASHARNIIKMISLPFGVTVETEDIKEGQWIDTVIVLAPDEEQAKTLAIQYVSEQRFVTEVLSVEAYRFTEAPARVIGRLINSDEE